MIALWMLYGIAVSLALCAAAASAERGLRLADRPARGVWAGAVAGAVALPALAYALGPFSPISSLTERFGDAAAVGSGGGRVPLELVDVEGGGAAAGSGPEIAATLLDLAAALDGPLLILWLALSAVLGGRLLLEWWRGRRRRWSRARIEGRRVLVAPEEGPALAGVLRPEIVVPEWFLELGPELRELALRHEEEHREAGDPWLVLVAEIARSLLPWNPGIHWAAGRLRRAAELDCDRRLLREGADRGAYGRLLVTVGRRSPGPSGVRKVALGEGTSDLKRRITMLRSRERDRWTGLRAVGAAVVALAAVAVACETPVPPTADEAESTANEVETVADAESAEGTVAGRIATTGRLSFDSPGAPLVVLDGVIMKEPPDLDALDIAAVEVIKGDDARAQYGGRAANGVIQITTERGEAERPTKADEITGVVVHAGEAREPTSPDSAVALATGEGVATGESPLVIVDGVIMGRDVDMEELNAMEIEMVEVVKGEAARALYGDRAKDGLIRITTKDGG